MFRLSQGFRKLAQNCQRFSSIKEARESRRAKVAALPTKSSSGFPTKQVSVLAILGLSGYFVYDIYSNPNGVCGKLYYGSPVDKLFETIYMSTLGQLREPMNDKLLPEWPTAPCYGNPPPGTPAPPLLVLDVEKTLIGSTYDAKHGWRHVKRPGLNKFLTAMNHYYEIVLFSENDIGVAQDILQAIDPEGRCHKLGAAAAEARGTVMLKRLDLMNRDMGRIILIDDNPESFQLCPRNTLQIRPFLDVNDSTDRSLEELIPLLQAMIHDEVGDFRDALDNLGTHEAEEAVTEYKMRLAEKKQHENRKRNVGLGGIIRSNLAINQPVDEVHEKRSTILSPAQIVGGIAAGAAAMSTSGSSGSTSGSVYSWTKDGTSIEKKDSKSAEAPSKKQGKLFQWLQDTEKEKEQAELIKREKMNEIYMQRMQAKQKQGQSVVQEEDDD
jgi:hypothetical protein